MEFTFPTTPEEAQAWKETFTRRALHFQVLVVAKTRIEGAWAAYIFPVPGQNHDREWPAWETDGEKLPKGVALAIFPEFEGLPYAR